MKTCICLPLLVLWCALTAREAAATTWDEAAPSTAQGAVETQAPVSEKSLLGLDEIDWTQPPRERRWTARAGAVILQRSQPRSQTLVSAISTGETLLNARDFDFGFQGGPDLTLISHGTFADLEVRYFGVNQWSDSQSFSSDPAGVQFHFADPSETQVDTGVNVGVTYTSALNSAEANLRHNVNERLTLLAGFRYLSLRENVGFGIDLLDGTPVIRANVSALNNLYGVQIGADSILWQYNRFRFEGLIKAGVFGNDARNSMQLQSFDGGGLMNAYRDRVSFAGEVGFTGAYAINEHWSLRAGYQLLWLSGVAVAAEQFPVIDPGDTSEILNVDTSGSVFYHGVNLGLECGW